MFYWVKVRGYYGFEMEIFMMFRYFVLVLLGLCVVVCVRGVPMRKGAIGIVWAVITP